MLDIKSVKQADNFVYYPKSGEDITAICEKFNVDASCVVATSEILEEGDVVIINKNAKKVYYAKPLDNLFKVAEYLNVDIKTLKQMNNLKSTKLFIGQKLFY